MIIKKIIKGAFVSLISSICYCGVMYGYEDFNTVYNSNFINHSVFATKVARVDKKVNKQAQRVHTCHLGKKATKATELTQGICNNCGKDSGFPCAKGKLLVS